MNRARPFTLPSMARNAARMIACVAVCLASVAVQPAAAQSFGKNKVHYEQLEWSVLETPHLRLHYYAAGREPGARADRVRRERDGGVRRPLSHRSRAQKVPLLLYSTHHLFQQTNATPEMLTESVGGLTELIKGRVLIPHNGSWARLRWVTRHELTHAYMLNKISAVMKVHHKAVNWLPDLWFTEGLAEYCGTTWDADAEGLLRDMVLSRMAYPMTQSEPITGSVEMYKEGQSFLLWLAARYGDARIFDLLENVWRADDFESAFQHHVRAHARGRRRRVVREPGEALVPGRGARPHARARWRGRTARTVASTSHREHCRSRSPTATRRCALLVRSGRGLGGPGVERAGARLEPARAAAAARRHERGVRIVPPVPEPARDLALGTDRRDRQARRARRALPDRSARRIASCGAWSSPSWSRSTIPRSLRTAARWCSRRRTTTARPDLYRASWPTDSGGARAPDARWLRRHRAVAVSPDGALGGVRLGPRASSADATRSSGCRSRAERPEVRELARPRAMTASPPSRPTVTGSPTGPRAAARATCGCGRPCPRARRGA